MHKRLGRPPNEIKTEPVQVRLEGGWRLRLKHLALRWDCTMGQAVQRMIADAEKEEKAKAGTPPWPSA